ncbi:glutathione S-transferase rho [Osmerus eperlanus]|uniref:glutathione S-transferase rho n=1 Tax=Osmerus eperlanus TaxID=29151 RepID=UPI002E0F982E
MAKSMTLLWCVGSPPCWRVMLALEEKNLQGYNQKLLSFEKGEHKSKEVMDLNPRGQVPTFKHGDIIVNESYGVCMYLESQFKSQGTKLIPDGPAEQGLVFQRMFEGLSIYQRTGDVIWYEYYIPEAERMDITIKRNMAALATEIKLWEGYLQKMEPGSYLAGKSLSMADVVVFPTIAFLFRSGLSAERYPRLGQYYELMKDRPSAKATWPQDWVETPGENTLKDL